MAQNLHINNYQERVTMLAREIYVAAGGRMLPSDTFIHAKRFLEEQQWQEDKARRDSEAEVARTLARANKPHGGTLRG